MTEGKANRMEHETNTKKETGGNRRDEINVRVNGRMKKRLKKTQIRKGVTKKGKKENEALRKGKRETGEREEMEE